MAVIHNRGAAKGMTDLSLQTRPDGTKGVRPKRDKETMAAGRATEDE
jgi:hypothetical protein